MTIFEDRSPPERIQRSSRGYTLIELTVVVLLISLMAVMAIPRFRYALLTDDLKSTTRKMTGIIRNLRNEAVRTQQTQYLHLDLESNRFWTDSAAMTEEERVLAQKRTSSLPQGVNLVDVWLKGEGKKAEGRASIPFTKKGYAPQAVIHLGSEDGRRFTLVLSPFLHRIEVMDDYVDFGNT